MKKNSESSENVLVTLCTFKTTLSHTKCIISQNKTLCLDRIVKTKSIHILSI